MEVEDERKGKSMIVLAYIGKEWYRDVLYVISLLERTCKFAVKTDN